MKKKISLFLCLLLAVFTLAGCSATEDETEYDVETLEQVTEFLITYCEGADEETFAQWDSATDYEMQYQFMEAGLPLTPDSFTGALDSWEAGIEECGEYISHGDYTYEIKNDSIEISCPVEYSERSATILFVFGEDQYLDSMTVNAEFTMGEILKKAGLNTLLGMGTVFAVLILIAFIISLFKYIPVISEMFKKKPKAEEKNETVAEPVIVQEEHADTDDLELIAVIAAAIAAAEGTGTDGFVVRSIKRRPSNKWNS